MLDDWGLVPEHPNLERIHHDPPMFRVRGFLSDAECDALIAAQRGKVEECEDYLNFRVNGELDAAQSGQHKHSAESAKLIEEWGIDPDTLAASDRSGFRTQVDPDGAAFAPIITKAKSLLALGAREPVFADGAWVRPTRRTFCVRDQTTVHYRAGEGVSPHVDGKDATVLIYLTDRPGAKGDVPYSLGEKGDEFGGATCFPEVGVRVPPEKGTALVYWSKYELLHYAEKVKQGEKWVCQLLVDFRIRDGEPDIDWSTGKVYNN